MGIMAAMTEDEELRELTELWPDEAQKAAAMSVFDAFEEEWWREQEDRLPARVDREGRPASPPPLGRVGKRRV